MYIHMHKYNCTFDIHVKLPKERVCSHSYLCHQFCIPCVQWMLYAQLRVYMAVWIIEMNNMQQWLCILPHYFAILLSLT